MKNKIIGLSIFLAIYLTGCFIPEKFDAKLTVNEDGSYVFIYDGTVVNAFALEDIANNGKLSEEDEKEMKEFDDEVEKDDEIKSVKYIGNARYKMKLEINKKKGEGLQVYEFFNVNFKEEVMNIFSTKLNDRDRKDIESVGATIVGKLKVDIPNKYEIVEHNADKKPKLGIGSYIWNIKDYGDNVIMKIKPKK